MEREYWGRDIPCWRTGRYDDDDDSASSDILLTGLLSWQAIIYLDVVKSRIQSDCHMKPKYAGMMDCFVTSYRQDGLTVFARGL